MADVRVALLRGINVGSAKRIGMADLRALFEQLGLRSVRTALNSGNVVFTASGDRSGDLSLWLERAIASELGVASRVTLLTAAELARAIRNNPFAGIATDPSRVLIMPLQDLHTANAVKVLARQSWAPEALAVRGRTAYLWCARGIAAGRVALATNKCVGERGTARNVRTMMKLMAMVEENA
jgi:uncharacterized protein (DUF1697 family)